MVKKKVFRFKYGYCHVLPDKLVLTRKPSIKSDFKPGFFESYKLSYYFLGCVFLVYLINAWNKFNANDRQEFILALLYLSLISLTFFASGFRSYSPIIQRFAIEKIELIIPDSNFQKRFFVIHFKDRNGKSLQRGILMPSQISNRDGEIAKALSIFKEENIPVEIKPYI